jgi:hypothetical protein
MTEDHHVATAPLPEAAAPAADAAFVDIDAVSLVYGRGANRTHALDTTSIRVRRGGSREDRRHGVPEPDAAALAHDARTCMLPLEIVEPHRRACGATPQGIRGARAEPC